MTFTASTGQTVTINGTGVLPVMTPIVYDATNPMIVSNDLEAMVNDVRLALGTMLDVGPAGPERLPAEHPMAGHLDVYQWLTVLQEYLVLGLMDKRR